MNLIILTESDRIDAGRYRLSDHRAEHIRAVLNLGEGDTVEVGVLNGPVGTARLLKVSGEEVELQGDEWRETITSKPEIDLICALPRPQTVKKVLLTAAMMGVRSVHLIRANRVEKSYFQSPLIEPGNQLPYLIEGLAQGRLTRLPAVQVHDRFRRFFEDELDGLISKAEETPQRLLCSPETTDTLDSVFDARVGQVTIAIGPEGGWVPFEIELMQERGFRPFTLGRWTLRVEHAVTSALAQVELCRRSP